MNKYGNKKSTFQGIVFASKLELRRWHILLARHRLGEIADLERQVRFPLMVGEVKIADYVADFVYRVVATGEAVIEDAKGVKTDVFRLKAKHMAAQGRPVSVWTGK